MNEDSISSNWEILNQRPLTKYSGRTREETSDIDIPGCLLESTQEIAHRRRWLQKVRNTPLFSNAARERTAAGRWWREDGEVVMVVIAGSTVSA